MRVPINGGLIAYLVGTALLVIACIRDLQAGLQGPGSF